MCGCTESSFLPTSLGKQGLLFIAVHRLHSLQWLLLLQSMGSRACRLNSCGTRAYLLLGVWGLPRSGVKPMFPALAGGGLETVVEWCHPVAYVEFTSPAQTALPNFTLMCVQANGSAPP